MTRCSIFQDRSVLRLVFKTVPVLVLCATISAGAARAQDDHDHEPAGEAGILYSKQKKVPPGPTEKETRLGDKTAADLEKNPKIKILDPAKDEKSKALYEKLNTMAKTLGTNSARPKIDYKVRVIEDSDVNAFTLPNGNIYYYTGLLDILGSDDEIAAVMAHEIGHNAEMHALRGSAKSSKASLIGMAVMLAALAGGGQSGADVALFSQYLLAGIISGYSVEYEKEADTAAVEMMQKSGYNPSALATVMNRFEAEEKRRPKTEPGIFRTHPPSAERAATVKKEVLAAGLDFNPRAVSGGASAAAVAAEDRVAVDFKGMTLMEFAVGSSGPSVAKQRAERAATVLNDLLKDNVQLHEIRLQAVPGSNSDMRLVSRGIEIARITTADAALQNLSPAQTGQKWRSNLRQIFWRETLHGTM